MLRRAVRTAACRHAITDGSGNAVRYFAVRNGIAGQKSEQSSRNSVRRRGPFPQSTLMVTASPQPQQQRRAVHTRGDRSAIASSDGIEGMLTPVEDLTSLSQGARVSLAGWLVKVHVLGDHLAFATLLLPRGQGRIQLIVRRPNEKSGSSSSQPLPVGETDVVRAWQAAGLHGVVQVEGVFGLRPSSAQKEHNALARFEVNVTKCTVLNSVETNTLPFDPTADPRSTSSLQAVSTDLRMRFRTLALRNEVLGSHIRLRSKVTHAIRQFLHDRNFDEIETPILLRSTPEGAREFLVPTRTATTMVTASESSGSSSHAHETHIHTTDASAPQFYALQQSPQQPKQLLVASGLTDRYFQIARCFRDEDGRKDRQPEFTQIDLEMSFVSRPSAHKQKQQKQICRSGDWTLGAVELRDVVEDMVRVAWETAGRAHELSSSALDDRFPVMTYDDAMRRFGSDKPDLRYGMELMEIGDIVRNAETEADGSGDEGGALRSQVEVLCFTPPPNGSAGSLSRSTIKHMLTAYPAVEYFWDNDGSPNVLAKLLLRKSAVVQRFLLEHELQAEEVDVTRLSEAIVEAQRLGALWGNSDSGDNGPTCLFVAPKSAYSRGGSTLLGDVRQMLMNGMQEQDSSEIATLLNKQGPRFVWIVDFPLFTRADADKDFLARGRWSSTHHPFTSPKEEDIGKLFDVLTDTSSIHAAARRERTLSSIKGQHYDLVLNGMEIGGGSVRIHRAALQRSVLRDVLQLAPYEVARFEHLLTALSQGAPPHAGIALGLDRLMAILCDTPTIRDVIAFPKSAQGRDLMLGCPDQIGNKDTAASRDGEAEEARLLRTYGLQRAII